MNDREGSEVLNKNLYTYKLQVTLYLVARIMVTTEIKISLAI